MKFTNGTHPYYGLRNSRSQRSFSKLGIQFSKKQKEQMKRVWEQIEKEKLKKVE